MSGKGLVPAGPDDEAVRHGQAQAVFYLAQLGQARAHQIGCGCIHARQVGHHLAAGRGLAPAKHLLHPGQKQREAGGKPRGRARVQGPQVREHAEGVDRDAGGSGAQKGHAEDPAIGGGALHVGQDGQQALAGGQQQAEVGVLAPELRAKILGGLGRLGGGQLRCGLLAREEPAQSCNESSQAHLRLDPLPGGD